MQELIKVDQALSRSLGVIKRFTGGGTVVVDANTIFTALIMQVNREAWADAFWLFKAANRGQAHPA